MSSKKMTRREKLTLEQEILLITKYIPEGIKLVEMEKVTGVAGIKLAHILKGLVEEGKVKKEGSLYFPIKQEEVERDKSRERKGPMPTKIIRKKDDIFIIRCAFCQGEGKDPFGLLSPLATCQVCGGIGEVLVKEPAIDCAFCGGTGVHRGQRLTCTACGGKGMVTVKKPVEKCPHCNGKGVAPLEYLPCLVCGGKGVVTAKKEKEVASKK